MEILNRAAATPPKKVGQAGAQKTFLKLRVLPCFAVNLVQIDRYQRDLETPFFLEHPAPKTKKQVLEYGCKMGGTQPF